MKLKTRYKLYSLPNGNKMNKKLFKYFFIRFSFMETVTTITLNGPTVVGHHVSVPSALIPFLHNSYILMEPLSLFFAKIAKIICKSI